MDSHKRMEEFDATQIETEEFDATQIETEEFDSTQIETEEIGEPERSEDWELVSVYEAEPSSIPYHSFPKMHDISESVVSLLDEASMKQDEPGTFPERDQESGKKIEDIQRLSLHEQHREIEGATGGVSLSKSFSNLSSLSNLSREMIVASKDSSQYDPKDEWVRREMIEALQEVPPPARRHESKTRESVKASSQNDPDDEWVRREMIEALQEVPPPVPSHERLSREIAEAPKDASQHEDSEWVRREMIEALQDASHYQRENESVRKEIVEAKQVVTQYVEENERVRKEIAEAMQDASQYDQEKGRVKEIAEAMPDVSHYKEENESVAVRIEAKNVRFIRNLQTEESESSARHELNSEPLICSAATSTFQEPDKLFQEANNTEQDDTNSLSTFSSKLHFKAAECVSSTTATGNAAANYGFKEIFEQFFKSNCYTLDKVKADIEEAKKRCEKYTSEAVVLKEDSSSSDEENKEMDNK